MRIEHLAKQQAETSGIQAKAFGFEMNSKMYSIMIDRMYKDKTGAILRELSCNALDSHVEAGCPEKPFDIHMPTWLDKTFSIRDYGTGIPHEKFEDIYTNIGASTKEGLDDAIGGWGIGGKSPFTVVDTFLVENWHGGTKTTWACFKSSGFPQVSEVERCSSSEPSGIKVSFAFEDNIADSFSSSLVKQLKFFAVKPKLTGESNVVWPVVPDYTGKDYFYYKDVGGHHRYSKSASVLMGTVAYPFTPDDLNLGYNSHLNKLFESPLCIVAPIGAVDVPPSRETLELTKKTKDYVLSVLNRIQAEYQKEFQDNLNKQHTRMEAMVFIRNANTHLLNTSHGTQVTWDGGKQQDTFSNLTRSSYPIPEAMEILKYARDLKTRWRTNHGGIPLTQIQGQATNTKSYKVYVDDLGIGGVTHRRDQSSAVRATADNVYIIKCHSETKRDLIDASCDTMLKTLTDKHGITGQKLSSVIGLPVRATRAAPGTAKKSKPDQIFLATANGNAGMSRDKMSRYKPSSCETVMPTVGYYLEIKGAQFFNNAGFMGHQMTDALDFAVRHTGVKVYLIRSSSVKGIPKTLRPFSEALPVLQTKAKELRELEGRWSAVEDKIPSMILTDAIVYLSRKDKDVSTLVRFRLSHNKKQVVIGYGEPFITSHTRSSNTPYTLTMGDRKLILKITKLAETYAVKYSALDQVFSRAYGRAEQRKILDAIKALGL